jgi:hypothetical protein
MNKTVRSTPLLVRFAVSVLVIVPCLLVPQATFSQEKKDEPKYPKTLVPRETIIEKKDAEKEAPKAPLMTCGKCPKGYVKTAVAAPESGTAPGANFNATAELCKGTLQSEDSMLVECKPIGYQNQMPVCGTCPEGYREVGRTLLPALCGNEDGGLRTQCQVPDMTGGMPDPTKGGRMCPPDCVGDLPTPGQGTLPPPPKIPSIEIRKQKQEESP